MPSPARFQTSNPGRVADRNQNYLIIVRPESRHIAIEAIAHPPELDALQKIVGGSIETIPHFQTIWGRRCVAFCNEEGKLKGLPPNVSAQQLWIASLGGRPGDHLVGPVAILAGSNAFLEAI